MFSEKLIIKTAGRRHLVTVALLFSFVFMKAQTTFGINDPRNPNCPCHKHQELADKEYAKLLRTGNKGNGEFVGKANSREDKIHKTRIEKYRKQKHKKRDKRIREPKWLYEFRHCSLVKKPKHPIKCPIWNDR
jgi:hypothetical protein